MMVVILGKTLKQPIDKMPLPGGGSADRTTVRRGGREHADVGTAGARAIEE